MPISKKITNIDSNFRHIMDNEILIRLLSGNHRLVIPGFGAFLKKDNGTGNVVVFSPFLKKDDGVLAGAIMGEFGIEEQDALAMISEFVIHIKESLESKGRYTLSGIGELSLDINGAISFKETQVSSPTAAPVATIIERQPDPQPIYQQPVPQVVAPQPVYQQPEPQTTTPQPSPQPLYRQPEPQIVTPQPVPQPVYRQPESQVVTPQPAPQPVYQQPELQTATPQPIYQQPEPQRVTPRPVAPQPRVPQGAPTPQPINQRVGQMPMGRTPVGSRPQGQPAQMGANRGPMPVQGTPRPGQAPYPPRPGQTAQGVNTPNGQMQAGPSGQPNNNQQGRGQTPPRGNNPQQKGRAQPPRRPNQKSKGNKSTDMILILSIIAAIVVICLLIYGYMVTPTVEIDPSMLEGLTPAAATDTLP